VGLNTRISTDKMTTVFVTLCDEPYLHKAIQTIKDIRGVGQWTGDIVLITVGFTLAEDVQKMFSITTKTFIPIQTDSILAHFRANPFTVPTCDGREFKKCTQWEKLNVFDYYFCRWERVFFVDAGLRLLDGVENFLSLEWRGRFLAPDDTWNDPCKTFRCQVEIPKNEEHIQVLDSKYRNILDQKYFLNCIFIFDTSLLDTNSKEEMVMIMNTFPIWRTNEMGVMNIYFTFNLNVWTPFPTLAKNGKYLFDWCEYNRSSTRWYNYCALKYPVTLPKGKTIGVAIPCYNKHIPKLLELLDSIDAQSRKPDIVSISCSSTKQEEFPKLREYGFGVLVFTTPERKNAGQNRNIAARRLNTDLISFFDADDHMHPQRIEGLMIAFTEPCDIALHSYLMDKETENPYENINTFSIIRNKLSQCYSGCITLDNKSRIHHSQVTVRREIFEKSPFSEEKEHEVKEDCVFCYRVFSLPGIQSAYIADPLSKYIPGFAMSAYKECNE
jgi:hypothetical protein